MIRKKVFSVFTIFFFTCVSYLCSIQRYYYIEIICTTQEDTSLVYQILKEHFPQREVCIKDNNVYLGKYLDIKEAETDKETIVLELNLSAKIVDGTMLVFSEALQENFGSFYDEDNSEFIIEISSLTKFVDSNTVELYSDEKIKKIISYAAELYATTPYKLGGENVKKGIDCSFFVKYIYSKLGVELPRTAREQIKVGQPISINELKVGDLVFFKKTYYRKSKKKTWKYERINHVGIYLRDGEFIHAARSSKKVTISLLTENYYKTHYAGARRILSF